MDAKRLGDATLHGWRETVSNKVARRAPIGDDVARAALGALWFAISLQYVVRSLRALRRELR
ncbi:MAG: hypothetical protein H0U90_08640 [Actinobacteria bacterium]|nr:hypothetical protein [Actinomycetota bacterium]